MVSRSHSNIDYTGYVILCVVLLLMVFVIKYQFVGVLLHVVSDSDDKRGNNEIAELTLLEGLNNLKNEKLSIKRDIFSYKIAHTTQKHNAVVKAAPKIEKKVETKPVEPKTTVQDYVKYSGMVEKQDGQYAFLEINGILTILQEGHDIDSTYKLQSINSNRILVKDKGTGEIYIIPISGL